MDTPETDMRRRAWLWDLPAACVLLTRLPMPRLPDAAFANPARSAWSYPLVGLLLAGLLGALSWILSPLPVAMQAGLLLAALVMMTGAMHEDGLADTADGLWGGQTRERRLEIMKDSRIGAYGVLALILALGLRWMGFAAVGWSALAVALVASRAAMVAVMHALPHARDDGLSRTVGTPSRGATVLTVAMAAGITFILTGMSGVLALLVTTGCAVGVASIARAKIGGQTGDILGATQIVTEIGVLLTFASLSM